MTTMTNVGTPEISDYDGRIVQINVTGVCNQNVKRVSTYQMRVPHNRMNEAMREISSLGGKITGVSFLENKSEATTEQPKKSKTPAKSASKSTTAAKRTSSPKSTTTTTKRTRRSKS